MWCVSPWYNTFLFCFTYSRWASTLPFCLWPRRIFPSLHGSRLMNIKLSTLTTRHPMVEYYLRTHAFRYGRQNKNPVLTRIELPTSALRRCAGYLLAHSGDEGLHWNKAARATAAGLEIRYFNRSYDLLYKCTCVCVRACGHYFQQSMVYRSDQINQVWLPILLAVG